MSLSSDIPLREIVLVPKEDPLGLARLSLPPRSMGLDPKDTPSKFRLPPVLSARPVDRKSYAPEIADLMTNQFRAAVKSMAEELFPSMSKHVDVWYSELSRSKTGKISMIIYMTVGSFWAVPFRFPHSNSSSLELYAHGPVGIRITCNPKDGAVEDTVFLYTNASLREAHIHLAKQFAPKDTFLHVRRTIQERATASGVVFRKALPLPNLGESFLGENCLAQVAEDRKSRGICEDSENSDTIKSVLPVRDVEAGRRGRKMESFLMEIGSGNGAEPDASAETYLFNCYRRAFGEICLNYTRADVIEKI